MTQRTGKDTTIDQVVDFSEVRAQRLDEKRRKTERIFFKNILGVYCVSSGDNQLTPIELVEVSEKGCSFQVPFELAGNFSMEEKLLTRLYFSQDTYIPILLTVVNARPAISDGSKFMRYGCIVDPDFSTFDVYQNFVRFLKLYSEHAHRDKGEVSVFYI